MSERLPAVAGLFYPDEPRALEQAVEAYLEGGLGPRPPMPPKVLVAPHAGYVYSGPIAGSAFAQLEAHRGQIERVIVIGPSHFVPFAGLATSPAEGFRTPLGVVPVDRQALASIQKLSQVTVLPAAHGREHCVEVELPFLQRRLGSFTLVPLVVGEASTEAVAEVLERLWGGPETLLVVSTDLSHYLDYETARARDAETSRRIVSLARTDLRPEDACGARAWNGLALVASRLGLEATLLDLRNSGDTAGPRDRVVGYGAFGLTPAAEQGR